MSAADRKGGLMHWGRRLLEPPVIILAGLVFAALSLNESSEPRSPFWFVEFFLYALMAHQMWRGGPRWGTARPGLAFVLLVLLFGAIYEASLTVDGTGIGGMHPDTALSYLFAFGDYLLLALMTLALIRRFGLDFRAAFFLAGGYSLSEGLIFTGVLSGIIASPMWPVSPLVLAYYTLAYASFIALPLLVLRDGALTPGPVRVGMGVILGLGFALSCITRVVWGLIYIPAVEWVVGI